MDEKILQIILFMPGFLFSLSFHEAAHGFVANLKGDATAKQAGRVTLNPVPHIDILGTLILPIMGLWYGGLLFGWGKPVPVNYRNLKNVKKDAFWISLAGPISNLFLAFVFAIVVRLYVNSEDHLAGLLPPESIHILGQTLVSIVMLNLALCFFNLIPIEPLDGAKILFGLLPNPIGAQIENFTARYGFIIPPLTRPAVSGFYRD
jgi:Zn-dependent protease